MAKLKQIVFAGAISFGLAGAMTLVSLYAPEYERTTEVCSFIAPTPTPTSYCPEKPTETERKKPIFNRFY
jgi:hypothetical protein